MSPLLLLLVGLLGVWVVWILVLLIVRLLHGKPALEKRVASLAERITDSANRERELLEQLSNHTVAHSSAARSETKKRIERIKQLLSEQETEPKKPYV